MNINIQNKPDSLAGFVFVYIGAQTFLGKLREDTPGDPYLEPVYVYRVGDEYKIDPTTKERVAVRPTRELRAPLGYPEIRRMDLPTNVGISVEQLLPESRAALSALVDAYEAKLRAQGLGSLRL